MTDSLLAALEIMGKGIGSLFTVMILIAISVVIFNKIDKTDDEKQK